MIPTLNRYEHFKRCIESLSRCTWADKTEVYVSLDYPPSDKYRDGYEKIKAYLLKCGDLGFKQLHVIYHERNLGAVENWYYLIRVGFDISDFIICTEDDNEFAPCFLDYMNKSLLKYKDDKEISSISACFMGELDVEIKQNDCILTYSMSAWGLGLWNKKVRDFETFDKNGGLIKELLKVKVFLNMLYYQPGSLNMIVTMYLKDEDWSDIKWQVYNYLKKKYQFRPVNTLVRNWGCDGSGVHSGANDKYHTVPIPNDSCFDLNGRILTIEDPNIFLFFKKWGVPTNSFKRWFWYMQIVYNYLSFCIKYFNK